MVFGEGAARAAGAKRFYELRKMRQAAAENIKPEHDITAARKEAKDAIQAWRDGVVEYYGTGTSITEGESNSVASGRADASMRARPVGKRREDRDEHAPRAGSKASTWIY